MDDALKTAEDIISKFFRNKQLKKEGYGTGFILYDENVWIKLEKAGNNYLVVIHVDKDGKRIFDVSNFMTNNIDFLTGIKHYLNTLKAKNIKASIIEKVCKEKFMLNLFPMVYSKAKTVDKITERLTKAPKQVQNSPEAFKGLVMEFRVAGNPLPGTLNEIYTTFGETEYKITATDGKLVVTRNPNGNFELLTKIGKLAKEIIKTSAATRIDSYKTPQGIDVENWLVFDEYQIWLKKSGDKMIVKTIASHNEKIARIYAKNLAKALSAYPS